MQLVHSPVAPPSSRAETSAASWGEGPGRGPPGPDSDGGIRGGTWNGRRVDSVREKTVLVVGVSGLIGHAAAAQFSAEPGWNVLGVSRRVPTDLPGVALRSVDLLDRASSLAEIGAMAAVTHLVYAAVDEAPGLVAGWFDARSIMRNETMLRNVIDGL